MSGVLQPPIRRRSSLPPVKGTPFYMTGEIAQDLCRLTGLSLDADGKFIDVSRLPFWDYWRVLWAWAGGNYYCFRNPPEDKRTNPELRELYDQRDRLIKANHCAGCESGWAIRWTLHGFPYHDVADEPGNIVGCTKGV